MTDKVPIRRLATGVPGLDAGRGYLMCAHVSEQA